MNNNMKKDFLKIGIIFFVTVAVVLWGLNFIFLNENAPKSKATGETMSLTFDPPTQTTTTATDFTVSVYAKPSITTVIRGYKTRVNFDKTKLQFKSIQYKFGLVSAGIGNTDANKDAINASGSIFIVGEDQTNVGKTLSSPNGEELVSITFSPVTNDPSVVVFAGPVFYSVNDNAALTSPWTYATTGLSVNGGVLPTPTGGAPSVCQSFSDDFSGTSINSNNWSLWTDNGGTAGFNTPVGEVTLFLPSSATGAKGVSLDSSGKHEIDGNNDFIAEITLKSLSSNGDFDSIFAYNSTSGFKKVQIVRTFGSKKLFMGVTQNESGDDYNNVGDVALEVVNTTPVKVKIEKKGSTINTYYDEGNGYQTLGTISNFTIEKGKIHFGAFGVDQSSANFDNFTLKCATVPAEDNAKLNLKLKFQGIGSKPPTDTLSKMKVRFRLYDENTEKYADNDNSIFTADEKGVWSGVVDFAVNPNHKYALLVKGSHHIQKRVCVKTPTETDGGTYKCAKGVLTLEKGDNDLDLSGIILLAGDLPVQDGTVDAYDISLVRNNIGKTDETSLAQSDINRDGKCDTQDYSLVIAALSVKSDEL